MGTFNVNIIPATSGLNLGTANQKWDAFVRNITTDNILSSTVNSAATGTLRLANLDKINWRNAANSADVGLSDSGIAAGNLPADLLVFSGAGVEAAAFVSSTVNPSVAGTVRLAKSDSLVFRNNINTADVIGIKHNTDDTITVGDANGVMSTSYVSDSANPAVAGQIRLAFGDKVSWRNAANSNDNALQPDASDYLHAINFNGVMVENGRLVFGNALTNAFPMFKQVGTTIEARLADDSGDAPLTASTLGLTGAVTKVNNFNTTSPGVAGIIKKVDSTGLTAAVATSLLQLGLGNFPNGMYRIFWTAKITTAATTGAATSTLGPLTIVYTDPDGVVVTLTAAAQIAAGTIATTSTANTTGTVLLGIPAIINSKSGTDITYAMGYASNTANQMAYNLHITMDYCG